MPSKEAKKKKTVTASSDRRSLCDHHNTDSSSSGLGRAMAAAAGEVALVLFLFPHGWQLTAERRALPAALLPYTRDTRLMLHEFELQVGAGARRDD